METQPRQWQWLVFAILGTYLASPLGDVYAQAETSREPATQIDPAGLAGKLLFAGQHVPDATLEVFAEIAAKHPRGLLVLRADYGNRNPSVSERLVQLWHPDSGIPLMMVDATSVDETRSARIVQLIEQSGSVWLAGDDPSVEHPALSVPELRTALAKFFHNAGNLAVSGSLPLGVVGQLAATEGPSLQLLPQLRIDLLDDAAAEDSIDTTPEFDAPHQVLLAIPPDGGVLVQRRHVISLGDDPAQVKLAETENKPGQTFTMQGKHRVMDHVGLRRAALDRIGEKFPPDHPEPTRVASGTLIIVGGGGMPEGIVQTFVDKAGGDEACILVLPTAMPDPLPETDRMSRVFRRAGAKEVHVLTGRSRDIVESPEYLELFSRATGIWFGGGRQWRFVDAYLDTAVEPLMHDVLRRGGVIMGSSAGASIQAEYMARGTPIGNQDIMADGYERGLGFLPGAAIDQHFRQRDRFSDMSTLVDRYPQLLGIGIDESTALIVEQEVGIVVGKGEVHFYNRREPKPETGPDYQSIASGKSYNLVERRPLEHRKSDQDESEEDQAVQSEGQGSSEHTTNDDLSVALPNSLWLIEPMPPSLH